METAASALYIVFVALYALVGVVVCGRIMDQLTKARCDEHEPVDVLMYLGAVGAGILWPVGVFVILMDHSHDQ